MNPVNSVTVEHKHEEFRNWMLGGLFLIAVMSVLTLMSVVFVPIFMALFLSAVLSPPVRFLTKLKIPRGAAAGLVLLAFCLAVGALGTVVYSPAAELRTRIPEIAVQIQERLYSLRQAIEEVQETAEEIERATEIAPETDPPIVAPPEEPPFLARVFAQARVLIGQAVATTILTLFLLSSTRSFVPDRVFAALGDTGRRLRTSIAEASLQMTRYVSIVVLINTGVGILAGLIALLTGLPNPLLWFVVVTLLSFVPYFGPAVSIVAFAAVAFVTFDSWWEVLVPVLLLAGVHFLEGELVTPMIMGRMMVLHPVSIIASVMIWGWMWGLAGAFLAVPILLTSAIVVRKVLLGEGTESVVAGQGTRLRAGPVSPRLVDRAQSENAQV